MDCNLLCNDTYLDEFIMPGRIGSLRYAIFGGGVIGMVSELQAIYLTIVLLTALIVFGWIGLGCAIVFLAATHRLRWWKVWWYR